MRIAAVGDVMLGDSSNCLGFGVASYMAQNGADVLLRSLQSVLPAADLFIGNLECPVGGFQYPPTDFHRDQFLGDPAGLTALAATGKWVMNVANNHMLQHGSGVFHDTVALLRSHGIGVVGLSGQNSGQPWISECPGVRLAVFGCSLRPETRASAPLPYLCFAHADDLRTWIESQIRQLESPSCDEPARTVVVLSIHWGAEFVDLPAPSQLQLAEQLFESGVDVILGHHPHVLQGIAIRGSKIAAFSLGNFVFDLWRQQTRRSAVLELGFCANGCADQVSVRPVFINRHGLPEARSSLHVAGGNWGCRLVDLAQLKRDAGSDEVGYWKRAARAEFLNALHNRLHFFLSFPRHPAQVRWAALLAFVQRRLRQHAPGLDRR